MAKANPLGNLEYELENTGFAAGDPLAQATVKNSPLPAPPITSRSAIEERIGSFSGGQDISGSVFPEK